MTTLYTVGHSNHSFEKFISLLTANGVTAVADVRSRPFSRRHPQFNEERLAAALAQQGIAYVFLGRELGARPEDPSCYENGKVQYERLSATPAFKAGIERALAGAEKFRVALMCAEKEPLDCHRTLLVRPVSRQRSGRCSLPLARRQDRLRQGLAGIRNSFTAEAWAGSW